MYVKLISFTTGIHKITKKQTQKFTKLIYLLRITCTYKNIHPGIESSARSLKYIFPASGNETPRHQKNTFKRQINNGNTKRQK